MKMHNILSKITILALLVGMFITSCEEDESFDFSKPFNQTLKGDIVKDMNLSEGEYNLKEVVRVKEGATLTIDAGTKVIASNKDGNDYSYLIIERGAKLVVNGTSAKPVVFTCDNMEVGSWGGIVINGQAPVNNSTEELEYGGDKADDNSGSIKNLKLEYAGESSEKYALTLNAVGSATVIENVEVTKSLGTGFGFVESRVTPVNLNVEDSFIGGEITKEMTLVSGTYTMVGGLTVKQGASLTIEAGAIVKVENQGWPALLKVEKGAQFFVEGTKSNPVVFTSDTESAGMWGGIVLNGNAPVNKANSNYGGDKVEDNSGSIKYLRVEYAGMNTEFAFEMNALGNKTIIENVEVYYCQRSAFGFKGGTVNAKYLMANGVGTTMFTWDQGWKGKGQFWLGYRNAASITVNDWAGGIVGQSGLYNGMALMPISNPTISNVTIVNDENAYSVMVYKTGTYGTLQNIILKDSPKNGCLVWGKEDAVNINNGWLSVGFVSAINLGTMGYNKDVLNENKFETSANFILDDADIALTDGFVGTTMGGKDMSLVDGWFESTTYKGAIAEDNNWTEGWTK